MRETTPWLASCAEPAPWKRPQREPPSRSPTRSSERVKNRYVVSAFRVCEQITFNAEAAEAAEKKCLGISPRALRALRSNVVFFHRLFRRTVHRQKSPRRSGRPTHEIPDRVRLTH